MNKPNKYKCVSRDGEINDVYFPAEVDALLDSQQSKLDDVAKELGCSGSPDVVMTAKLCYEQWTRRIDEVSDLQSKLDEQSKEIEGLRESELEAIGLRNMWMNKHDSKAAELRTAEARVKELEAQIEAAKVEGFNVAIDKAAEAARSKYHDRRYDALDIARLICDLRQYPVTDSKRGVE